MERVTSSSVVITLLCIATITCLIKLVNFLWLRPKKIEKMFRQQGIPGTSYRFLVGDWKDLNSMVSQGKKNPVQGNFNDYIPRVEPFRQKLKTRFGKTYFIWAGPVPMLQTSSPDLVKEVLTKMQDYQKVIVEPLDKIFTGLLNYNGEKWAKHRRMINPAFHMKNLKLMSPACHDSCAEMISKWDKIVSETGSSELDVWPYLTSLTAEVISRAAFGSSYQEGQRIFELLKEQQDLALEIVQSFFIPGSRYIPSAEKRRFKEANNLVEGLLKGIINTRKQAIKDGKATKTDLLGIIMDSNLMEIQQAEGINKKGLVGVSLLEMIDDCKLLYVAGQETTSSLLVWTMVLLSKHQDWQARAREEVFQTFGENAPGYDGLNHLKTVTMILYEVLRLYPPLTLLGRGTHKDTKLGELTLPAGVIVILEVLFVHRDKEIWGEDAEQFNPDRFSEGISHATRGNNCFFPFGWGPRICIGERFALTEAKMAMAMILSRFSFELSPSYVHAPKMDFFLKPENGALIILHKLH